jgi:hypothetical protein
MGKPAIGKPAMGNRQWCAMRPTCEVTWMADHYRAQIPYESCALAKHWTKPGELTEQARPCHEVMRRRGPGRLCFCAGM